MYNIMNIKKNNIVKCKQRNKNITDTNYIILQLLSHIELCDIIIECHTLYNNRSLINLLNLKSCRMKMFFVFGMHGLRLNVKYY